MAKSASKESKSKHFKNVKYTQRIYLHVSLNKVKNVGTDRIQIWAHWIRCQVLYQLSYQTSLFFTFVHMHGQTSLLPIYSQGMKSLLWPYRFKLQIYQALSKKKIQIQDRDKFHYPFLKQYLSISFLLLNTSKNQKLLVVRLLERCHNNSTFTLRLLQRLEGNLKMLRKSQEL